MALTQLKGKTILQILPRLEQGGVERGTLEVAKAIIKAGGRAVVISSGGGLVASLRRMGAVHITLPVERKNPFYWWWIRRQVRQAMLQERVDLVHIRSRAPAWIAMAAARTLKLPVVTTIHGRFQAHNPFKRYYNSIMLRADYIIVISDYIAGLVRAHFPDATPRITRIYRGVDVVHFDADAITAQRVINAAQHLGIIPGDKKIVMLPARPSLWKGHKVMIEAMRHLTQHDALLVLVGALSGGAGFQRELMDTIAKLGLERRVKLAPLSIDMPAALMLADVVVMPSLTPEPFGRVAIEAQAVGRPVVAFDHGGAAESVIHNETGGETGYLAQINDARGAAVALAEAVDQALALKKTARKRLITRARQHVLDHFTTEQMVAKTLRLYADAIKTFT